MSFDWMDNAPIYHREGASRDQGTRAIAERARLLHRMGRSEAETRRRIEDDVRWEHDGSLPSWYGELPSIIAAIYKRSKSKG